VPQTCCAIKDAHVNHLQELIGRLQDAQSQQSQTIAMLQAKLHKAAQR